jgi:hypothetical protein
LENRSVQANLAVATTSRDDFRVLAAEHRVVPVTRKVLADAETPLSAYRKLAANRPAIRCRRCVTLASCWPPVRHRGCRR